MIYVSSGGFKENYINIYKKFSDAGIKNIEFSGGVFDHNQIDHLKNINNSGLDISLHNYAIPPAEPFVLNLSSSNKDIFNKSIAHVKRCIYVSSLINSNYYSFHAGFRFDPIPSSLGKKMNSSHLLSFDEAFSNFKKASIEIINYAKIHNIELFIENNVISRDNYETFSENPFLFTGGDQYNDFISTLDEPKTPLLKDDHTARLSFVFCFFAISKKFV